MAAPQHGGKQETHDHAGRRADQERERNIVPAAGIEEFHRPCDERAEGTQGERAAPTAVQARSLFAHSSLLSDL
ncbi:hypothetical protein [Streptomyces sp. JHA26]|uniref:hypothetical protein n=1 Tax=Streptomyces sp. JHA26 TaxID=1917143 RepID=UPI00117ED077|nr:hypothetical protein [Streptomyces sp. JHA26]